jgi:hypothetical protein
VDSHGSRTVEERPGGEHGTALELAPYEKDAKVLRRKAEERTYRIRHTEANERRFGVAVLSRGEAVTMAANGWRSRGHAETQECRPGRRMISGIGVFPSSTIRRIPCGARVGQRNPATTAIPIATAHGLPRDRPRKIAQASTDSRRVSTVKDLVAGSGLASAQLKGVPEEWRLYSVDRRDRAARVHLRLATAFDQLIESEQSDITNVGAREPRNAAAVREDLRAREA